MHTPINIRLIFTLLISLIICLLVLRPIDNFDVWWHLNSGLWMLGQGQILDHDIWSFTQSNAPWINIAWLFQLSIAVAYKSGGIWALFIFKALCLFFVFWFISRSISLPEKTMAYVFSFLILLPDFYGHLHLRPHLFELLALASLIWFSQHPWSIRKSLVGFIILLIWANSHASIAAGAMALAFQVLFGNWQPTIKGRTRLIVAIVFLLTPFMTPYGTDIFNVLFTHGNSDFIQYYISEWLPHDIYPAGMWFAFIISILLFLNKKISISIAELFLLIFFLYYSVKYQRFELEFSILLLRPLTESVAYGLNILKQQNPRLPALVSLLIILIHSVIYSGHIQSLSPAKYNDAPYDRFRYPLATITQLKLLAAKLNRTLRVINDYNYGGYISLFTDGDAKIYIDGRMSTVFPESLLLPPYETDLNVLKQLSNRYQVDAVLLKLDKGKLLSSSDPDWQLVGYDVASVLFVKRSLLGTMDFPLINYDPENYNNNYEQKQLAANVYATKKLLALEPDNPIAINHIAVFLTNDTSSADAQPKAFEYLDKSAQLYPKDIFSRATYAYLLAKNNSGQTTDLFFKFLPPANKLTPGISMTYDLTYARVLIDSGFPDLALDYLYPEDKNRRYNIDKLLETWKLRILAHFELKEIGKARNCLNIGYELIDDRDKSQRQDFNNLNRLLNSSTNN